MSQAEYEHIDMFQIRAKCTTPLHVGSANGGKADLLVHPLTGEPFIQATSIAGVLRSGFMSLYGKEKTDELFGFASIDEGHDGSGKIRISDGLFDMKTVVYEIRPRLKINGETGTCDSSDVQGTNVESGNKFETKYIGTGAEFTFDLYIMGMKSCRNSILELLGMIREQELQFGGQKSNGCGFLDIVSARYHHYNLKKKADRDAWIRFKGCTEADTIAIPEVHELATRAYLVTVKAETRGELLVKAIATSKFGEDAADAVNIRNTIGEYIIPGSSLKGVLRSRMQWIADYQNLPKTLIAHAFGETGKHEYEGHRGNLIARDVVVGDIAENKQAELRDRIRLDKFTGGVMYTGKFTEQNVHGKMKIELAVADDAYADDTMRLLLPALRDLAVGQVSIGSGASVGKGFLKVHTITVRRKKDERSMTIDFDQNRINDPSGMLTTLIRRSAQ